MLMVDDVWCNVCKVMEDYWRIVIYDENVVVVFFYVIVKRWMLGVRWK